MDVLFDTARKTDAQSEVCFFINIYRADLKRIQTVYIKLNSLV